MGLESVLESMRSFARKQRLSLSLAASLSVFGCSSDSTKQTEQSSIQHTQALTNSDGKVTLGLYDQNVPIAVTDENGNPLGGMEAHVVGSKTEGTVLVIDPTEDHYPSRKVFSSTITQDLGHFETKRQSILGEIIVELPGVDLVYKIIKELSNIERGDLLERGENTNKYCMSISQMRNDYFEVIPGLILLAAEEAGLPTEEVKVAARTTLADIFEEHIVTKYGQHAGYEIEVPNTSMSVCGGEYNGVICDLSDNQLSEILNPDLPYWKINGDCLPSGVTEDIPFSLQDVYISEARTNEKGVVGMTQLDPKSKFRIQSNDTSGNPVDNTNILFFDGKHFSAFFLTHSNYSPQLETPEKGGDHIYRLNSSLLKIGYTGLGIERNRWSAENFSKWAASAWTDHGCRDSNWVLNEDFGSHLIHKGTGVSSISGGNRSELQEELVWLDQQARVYGFIPSQHGFRATTTLATIDLQNDNGCYHEEPEIQPGCEVTDWICKGDDIYRVDDCGNESLIRSCLGDQYCDDGRCKDSPVGNPGNEDSREGENENPGEGEVENPNNCLTEDCPDNNCFFYDGFNEVEECKWERFNAEIGRDYAIVAASDNSPLGQMLSAEFDQCIGNFTLEVRARVNTPEISFSFGSGRDPYRSKFSLSITHQDYPIHTATLGDNVLNLPKEGFAPTEFNTFQIRRRGNTARIQVNGSPHSDDLSCSNNISREIHFRCYGFDEGNCEVDYVKLTCD